MQIKKFLKELNFSPSKEELTEIRKKTEQIVSLLRNEIKKRKINADVFVGGSYPKGTLAENTTYDIDTFVRFDLKYLEISALLEKIVKNSLKKFGDVTKIHGSRDYFKVSPAERMSFEIIPVAKIGNPKEARNVTDLSYFHVNYVKRKLKNNMAGEVILAKKFCESLGVYGAESYIHGFSGYGLECLIIYYKSFEKMLLGLSKVKDRIIIDIEKRFKNKKDILFELNENKIQCPIILIDPTWKERNALAALSYESFHKFQKRAKDFLKKPKREHFEIRNIEKEKLERAAEAKGGEFLSIHLRTEKQEGDIAGTKLKKFAEYLETEISRYFDVLLKEFLYGDEKEAVFYIGVRSKGEIIKFGPPVSMKAHAYEFKKKNDNVFEKGGFLRAKVKVDFTAKDFVERWAKENEKKMNEMGIVELAVE